MRLQMTLQTSCGVTSGIYNESPSPAADCDMPAAGSVTSFASRLACQLRPFEVHPRVRTGGKKPRDIGVTFEARLISHKCRPLDILRHNHSSLNTGAGNQQTPPRCGPEQE